jgi:hypothetical protein
MKRLLILVMAFLLPFSAFSQENLTSRPVGFVRVELPPGVQTLVSTPFVPFDNSINAILSGQLTGSTNEDKADKVFKWDAAKAEYVAATMADGTGKPGVDGKWFTDLVSLMPSDMTIEPGEGFCVYNHQDFMEVINLCGEVALDPTNTTTLLPMLNLIGYPYSTPVSLSDTYLLENDVLSSGDELIDSTGELSVTNPLRMGRGYWYKRNGDTARVWNELRPYGGDGLDNDGFPCVTDMRFNWDRTEIVLTIECGEKQDQTLDIMSKDLNPTNSFDTASGWQLMEGNIPISAVQTSEEVSDTGTVRMAQWTDIGVFGTGKRVNEVFGRAYLIGRADIDSDGDGIPDARERFVYGTDPRNADTDGDGMPDGWEITNGLNPLKDDSVGNPDGDGKSNIDEYRSGTSPQHAREKIATIYVDATVGDDTNNGLSEKQSIDGGPKRSVNSAFRIAIPGDTVVVFGGVYYESVAVPSGVTLSASGDVRFE